MRWSEFVKEAMVTAPMNKGRAIEGLVRAIGLCGEAQEVYQEFTCAQGAFDRKRMTKELGDFAWYAAALWGWCGFDDEPLGLSLDMLTFHVVNNPRPMDTGHLPSALMNRAGKVGEVMKKHIGHDKPLDRDQIRMLLTDAICSWCLVVHEVGMSPEVVLNDNVAKLRARYKGGGFTPELANAPRTDE